MQGFENMQGFGHLYLGVISKLKKVNNMPAGIMEKS